MKKLIIISLSVICLCKSLAQNLPLEIISAQLGNMSSVPTIASAGGTSSHGSVASINNNGNDFFVQVTDAMNIGNNQTGSILYWNNGIGGGGYIALPSVNLGSMVPDHDEPDISLLKSGSNIYVYIIKQGIDMTNTSRIYLLSSKYNQASNSFDTFSINNITSSQTGNSVMPAIDDDGLSKLACTWVNGGVIYYSSLTVTSSPPYFTTPSIVNISGSTAMSNYFQAQGNSELYYYTSNGFSSPDICLNSYGKVNIAMSYSNTGINPAHSNLMIVYSFNFTTPLVSTIVSVLSYRNKVTPICTSVNFSPRIASGNTSTTANDYGVCYYAYAEKCVNTIPGALGFFTKAGDSYYFPSTYSNIYSSWISCCGSNGNEKCFNAIEYERRFKIGIAYANGNYQIIWEHNDGANYFGNGANTSYVLSKKFSSQAVTIETNNLASMVSATSECINSGAIAISGHEGTSFGKFVHSFLTSPNGMNIKYKIVRASSIAQRGAIPNLIQGIPSWAVDRYGLISAKDLFERQKGIFEVINENSSTALVFPNPISSGEILSVLCLIKNKLAHYELVDVLGRKIKSGNLTFGENRLLLSGLRQGIYFISVNVNREIDVFKIIVK